MIMSGKNQLDGLRRVHADTVKVAERGWLFGFRIETGVYDGPISVAKMQDNALPESRPKYRHL
jgi:hypothetical protein